MEIAQCVSSLKQLQFLQHCTKQFQGMIHQLQQLHTIFRAMLHRVPGPLGIKRHNLAFCITSFKLLTVKGSVFLLPKLRTSYLCLGPSMNISKRGKSWCNYCFSAIFLEDSLYFLLRSSRYLWLEVGIEEKMV